MAPGTQFLRMRQMQGTNSDVKYGYLLIACNWSHCWRFTFFFSGPLSSKSWGRGTNQRYCSVSCWWRTKVCTVVPPTWISFATFTERSGSCSLNHHHPDIIHRLIPTGLWETQQVMDRAQISQGQSPQASLNDPQRWENKAPDKALRYPELPLSLFSKHTVWHQITTCQLNNVQVNLHWKGPSVSCTETAMTSLPEAKNAFLRWQKQYVKCHAFSWFKCFSFHFVDLWSSFKTRDYLGEYCRSETPLKTNYVYSLSFKSVKCSNRPNI